MSTGCSPVLNGKRLRRGLSTGTCSPGSGGYGRQGRMMLRCSSMPIRACRPNRSTRRACVSTAARSSRAPAM
ncbi:MAG: hypothetical protein MZU79_03145 [Anaerotruncus sp.]|nr:hypothetical protein [Anaerotruncus sp.]